MERPILFSTEMVKALIEGRKTQTRRSVKINDSGRVELHGHQWHIQDPNAILACPYGQIGDKLWVRETWCLITGSDEDGDPILYKANTEDDNEMEFMKAHGENVKWHPSIFMPRWASRLTLEITNIRVQRVQEISQQDAIQEGIFFMGGMADNWDDAPWCASLKDQEPMKYPSVAYGRLWDSINGKTHPWESNPWVWAISFKVLEGTK